MKGFAALSIVVCLSVVLLVVSAFLSTQIFSYNHSLNNRVEFLESREAAVSCLEYAAQKLENDESFYLFVPISLALPQGLCRVERITTEGKVDVITTTGAVGATLFTLQATLDLSDSDKPKLATFMEQ